MARAKELSRALDKNDDEVPNIFFGSYKGKDAYFLKFKFNGKSYNYKNITKMFSDTTLTAAKNRLTRVKGQLQNGIDPFELASKPVETRKDRIKDQGTLKEYIAEYTDAKKKKQNSESMANYYSSYQKHFEPLLGDMLLTEFDLDTATELFNKVKLSLIKNNLGEHVLDNIKKILNPALKRKASSGIIFNPLEHPDFLEDFPKAKIKKLPLMYRINAIDKLTAFIKLAQELYYKSLHYEQPKTRNEPRYSNDLYRAAFLISTMCGRRVEEYIQRMDWDHVSDNWLVLATTKTGKIEEYPLPDEVINILKKYRLESGIIFQFRPETFHTRFNDIINSISSVKFRKNEKYNQHDKRVLLVSILTAKNAVDRQTADKLISHAIKNVSNTYHNTLNDKELMEEYWNLLRAVNPSTFK